MKSASAVWGRRLRVLTQLEELVQNTEHSALLTLINSEHFVDNLKNNSLANIDSAAAKKVN